jgi:hypothetical protein
VSGYAIEVPASTPDLLDMAPKPALVPLAQLTKRATFFLAELLAAGREGISTIAYPGVRVGDAIHKLRKAGVEIETHYVEHGGEFAGHHGRYVLRSRIVRLADTVPIGTTTMTEQRAAL